VLRRAPEWRQQRRWLKLMGRLVPLRYQRLFFAHGQVQAESKVSDHCGKVPLEAPGAGPAIGDTASGGSLLRSLHGGATHDELRRANRGSEAASDAWRRWAHEQALASTRIEGHVPTPEFLADCEAVIQGTMTTEQARAASLARAVAKDRATGKRPAASQAASEAE
jgi:hypothetical protein